MKEGARTPFTAVRGLALRLDGGPGDYDALLELAAGKRFVLLGEATHGTHDNLFALSRYRCKRGGTGRIVVWAHNSHLGEARVAAASHRDGDVELKRVRPALPESCEHLFYSARLERFSLPLVDPAAAPLDEAMLERAIGVICLPETGRASHYFHADLREQFDAVFHLDETEAVEPFDVTAHWHRRVEAEEA